MNSLLKIRIQISKKENALAYNKQIGETIELPYRDYLRGVVASEIGNAPVEACKVQAIASRTFSYPYASSGKAISDSSQKAQSFRASRVNNQAYQNAYQAVDETDNQVLTHNGKIISPCSFSSSNGGKTASSQSRWGGYRAWLIEQNDPWDMAATGGKKTGHGVGMSQMGAKYAAKAGFSYRDILSFYYPNTTIELMKGVDESMSVKASY